MNRVETPSPLRYFPAGHNLPLQEFLKGPVFESAGKRRPF